MGGQSSVNGETNVFKFLSLSERIRNYVVVKKLSSEKYLVKGAINQVEDVLFRALRSEWMNMGGEVKKRP